MTHRDQKLSSDDLVLLEGIIDRHGLNQTLSAAALIAHEKADHVATNWQDTGLAKSWERDGNKLGRLQLEN